MKNTLMQYKGGGYDGCFWEWNFCYWNDKGEWHDIQHSGRMGCENEKQALEFMENEPDDFYLCDLTEKGLSEFEKESAKPHVLGVFQALEKDGLFFGIVCTECGDKVDPSSCTLGDFRGCGGLASTADSIICDDCRCNNSCAYCGEYCGDETLDEDGYCEYCAEEQKEEREKERKEEERNSEA